MRSMGTSLVSFFFLFLFFKLETAEFPLFLKCVLFFMFFCFFCFFFTYSSRVRIVTSQRCAMGKSLYINRLGEALRAKLGNPHGCVHVTIPLHGPVVTSDTLLEFLQDHMKNPSCCIYHIDISSSVSKVTYWEYISNCLYSYGSFICRH